MPTIFVPRNPIEVAQELQYEIDMAHPECAAGLAQQAQELLGDVREIYGTQSLIIHALSGYVIDRKLTVDEQMLQYQFDELVLRGHFGGLPFVQKLESPRIQSFVADMYDVEILEPRIDENPTGRISPPIMLPVLGIQTVLAAA